MQQRDYKAKYYELRRTAKELLFENSAYQSEIEECRGKILKRERERELLLQHLLQYEQEEWELQREVHHANNEKTQTNNKVVKKQNEPAEKRKRPRYEAQLSDIPMFSEPDVGLSKIPKIKIVFQDSKGGPSTAAATTTTTTTHHHHHPNHHLHHHHHHHHQQPNQQQPEPAVVPPPLPAPRHTESEARVAIKNKIKRSKVDPIVISLPAVAKEPSAKRARSLILSPSLGSSLSTSLSAALGTSLGPSLSGSLSPSLGPSIGPLLGPTEPGSGLTAEEEIELAKLKLSTALKTNKQRFESVLNAANLERGRLPSSSKGSDSSHQQPYQPQ